MTDLFEVANTLKSYEGTPRDVRCITSGLIHPEGHVLHQLHIARCGFIRHMKVVFIRHMDVFRLVKHVNYKVERPKLTFWTRR